MVVVVVVVVVVVACHQVNSLHNAFHCEAVVLIVFVLVVSLVVIVHGVVTALGNTRNLLEFY